VERLRDAASFVVLHPHEPRRQRAHLICRRRTPAFALAQFEFGEVPLDGDARQAGRASDNTQILRVWIA